MKKLLLTSVLSLGLAYGMMSFNNADEAQAQKQIAPALKFGDPLPANAFVELAKMINPTVVNISTSTKPKNMGRGRDPFMDMLEEFYGFRMGPGPQQRMPQQALGTGFVIREDGLIVTNNHVIAGADKIQVQFTGSDKMHDAKLIGSDERTDIALIKIKGNKFPVAQLGNSTELQVGEWVAAFGNPLGQGHTMTKGIISAKGREIGEINRFPLIQTDTPINPGNSGGPLVNMQGQVIGVNSAIAAHAQGIGFAIPIDEVKAILPQLEKEGKIKRGYLGIGLADLNPQAAAYLGMKEDKGALIASVDPNAPAGKAGIQPYDVVVEFNGKKIERALDLSDAVSAAQIGSTVKVKLIREGKTRTLDVKIADFPSDRKLFGRRQGPQDSLQATPHALGFSMAESNRQLRREFNVAEEFANHPIVVGVEPGSKAEEVGLAAGDVILEVNRKSVKTIADVTKNMKNGTNTFRVARGRVVAIIIF